MRFGARTALLASAAIAVVGISAPAFADTPRNFNNAKVSLTGGNAAALAGCVNVAKKAMAFNKTVQSNACRNVATAVGGTVKLDNVDVTILQSSSGLGTNSNNATVTMSGGDASAVAACLNYLQGTWSTTQANNCRNTASAQGGDVKLDKVNITILQS